MEELNKNPVNEKETFVIFNPLPETPANSELMQHSWSVGENPAAVAQTKLPDDSVHMSATTPGGSDAIWASWGTSVYRSHVSGGAGTAGSTNRRCTF